MATYKIYIGSDNNIILTGMRDSVDDSYLNSATVTYAIYAAEGYVRGTSSPIASGTGSLSYVSASNGNYRGTIDSTVTTTLTEEDWYYVVITFDQSSYEDERTLYCQAVLRGNR